MNNASNFRNFSLKFASHCSHSKTKLLLLTYFSFLFCYKLTSYLHTRFLPRSASSAAMSYRHHPSVPSDRQGQDEGSQSRDHADDTPSFQVHEEGDDDESAALASSTSLISSQEETESSSACLDGTGSASSVGIEPCSSQTDHLIVVQVDCQGAKRRTCLSQTHQNQGGADPKERKAKLIKVIDDVLDMVGHPNDDFFF